MVDLFRHSSWGGDLEVGSAPLDPGADPRNAALHHGLRRFPDPDRGSRAGRGTAIPQGGGLDAFEKIIGPVETVQAEWFRHVQTIKAALDGKVRDFYKTGQLPPDRE